MTTRVGDEEVSVNTKLGIIQKVLPAIAMVEDVSLAAAGRRVGDYIAPW